MNNVVPDADQWSEATTSQKAPDATMIAGRCIVRGTARGGVFAVALASWKRKREMNKRGNVLCGKKLSR